MLADRIRDARAQRRAVRIVAGGHWLDAGRPVTAPDTLSVAGDRGIVEYVPGDLTLTARAGTPVSELYAATKEHGQWLPLDPWGGDRGSIGATIATATAGPHAHAMGLPRDVVLGLEFISGAGDTIRAGGRVVKNVAGFDLTRLVIGSWGTLGVVTEVTVRLRARPPIMRTLRFAVDPASAALNQLAVQLRALPFTPLAAELVNATLAVRLGLARSTWLLVRVGGNETSVARQLDLLRAFGAAEECPDTVWSSLRGEPDPAASWRCSGSPSRFGDTWTVTVDGIKKLENAELHGSVARGVVRVCAGATTDGRQLAACVPSAGNALVVERLPADAWAALTLPARDPLHESVRARFDPDGILNPGIMGGMT